MPTSITVDTKYDKAAIDALPDNILEVTAATVAAAGATLTIYHHHASLKIEKELGSGAFHTYGNYSRGESLGRFITSETRADKGWRIEVGAIAADGYIEFEIS